MTHSPPRTSSPRTPAGSANRERRTAGAIVAVKRVFGAETGNYFLLLGTTLFLVLFGLIMVLSSSSVEEISSGGSFFSAFLRQGLYALLGIPLMLVASRMPVSFWKRWAWPAIALGALLQLLVFVPGLGYGYGGNQNWIRIGNFTAQPSELVKLALAVWLAWVVTAKKDLLHDWKHVFVPIAPVAGLAIGFVLLGNDLGTAIVMLAMVLAALFYAGVKLRVIATAVVVVSALGIAVASLSDSRTARIEAWLTGCSNENDFSNYCWQTVHGWWALADGGILGSGLGGSRAKWNWLPEADNDFIFAIIGDELGLIGSLVVLVLFVVLSVTFVRIMRSTTDNFSRIVTGGVMIWIVGQAFINIAVVLGVLPVLGVPLPLISAGGSALIASLLAVGVVLSFARHRPEPVDLSEPVTPSDRSRSAAARRSRPLV
ncbi:cell division-specific peptidoglycan biosynthesis regulator FtsW [Glaciihabitans tibetensis]|uniref:Probable peptidoglycan glycosyltransferase FtsW n=1 Tax=Glaciihabitans tibetensis TaxID=1266600 RepID=A0A2T0VEC1_9MICO|nr:putative lipid II flippase FtsW [Glaciihabitans tibetensis]PRY68527.1 cell division-specific peptidoglycan biosynthesis regulator FtsW [Glaciihabitans tibetensis]